MTLFHHPKRTKLPIGSIRLAKQAIEQTRGERNERRPTLTEAIHAVASNHGFDAEQEAELLKLAEKRKELGL